METTATLVDKISGAGIYASAANWAVSADNADTLGGQPSGYYYTTADAAEDFSAVHEDIDYLSAAIDDIPAQVQSDWEQSNSAEADYIKNKPTNLEISAGDGIGITEVNNTLTFSVTGDYADAADVDQLASTVSAITDDIDFLSGAIDDIPAQVQSDWEQSNSAEADYIKNKPEELTMSAGSGIGITEANNTLTFSVTGDYADSTFVDQLASTVSNVTDDITAISAAIEDLPGAVQSDWTEDDNTDPAYIQNKPTQLGLSAGEGIVITETSTDITFAVDSSYITDAELTSALADFGGFEVVTGTGTDLHPDVTAANTKTIYLTQDTTAAGADQYKEWIWKAADPEDPQSTSAWNLIGDTSIDLNGYAQMPASHTASNIAVYGQGDTLVDNNVPLSGVQNVQSNWNESDSTSYAYIANKPEVLIPQSGAGISAAPKYLMVVTAMPAAAAIDPNTIYLVQGTYIGT